MKFSEWLALTPGRLNRCVKTFRMRLTASKQTWQTWMLNYHASLNHQCAARSSFNACLHRSAHKHNGLLHQPRNLLSLSHRDNPWSQGDLMHAMSTSLWSYINPRQHHAEWSMVHYSFGVTYPSVTTVLSHTKADQMGLSEWRASMGEEAAAELARCQTRGEKLHSAVEYLIKENQQPPMDGETVGCSAFASEKNQQRYSCGRSAMGDVLRIAGRVDLVAEYDGVLTIIDIKGSTHVKQRDTIKITSCRPLCMP